MPTAKKPAAKKPAAKLPTLKPSGDVTLDETIGPPGRATVFFRGRQVGYYRKAIRQLNFAPVHQDKHQAALVLEELELAGVKIDRKRTTNPPPLPPPDEALEELEGDE